MKIRTRPFSASQLKVTVWALLALAGALLLLLFSHHDSPVMGKTISTHKCDRIGQQASIRIERFAPKSTQKLRSKVLVLDCLYVQGLGHIEIVGYDTNQGFCFAIDNTRKKTSENASCSKLRGSWRTFCGQKICSYPLSWSTVGNKVFSEVAGETTKDVDQVKAYFRGKANQGSPGIIVHLGRKLQERLDAPSDFRMFFVVYEGCVERKAVPIIGIDAAGDVVSTVTAPNLFPDFCVTS